MKGNPLIVRKETAGDAAAIRDITTRAFLQAAHRSGTEAKIIEALRDAEALTLSLVVEHEGNITGHVAFSPVCVNGQDVGWFGLGPVAVNPDVQNRGVGSALIREGLSQLAKQGAQGCVVLGEPEYYGRFGFACCPQLQLQGVPPEYFMALSFRSSVPAGEASYHPAFYVE